MAEEAPPEEVEKRYPNPKNALDERSKVTYCRDVYLDISCANCGSFHHQGKAPIVCPYCGTPQIVVAPHDFEIDARFRAERENMLNRMD